MCVLDSYDFPVIFKIKRWNYLLLTQTWPLLYFQWFWLRPLARHLNALCFPNSSTGRLQLYPLRIHGLKQHWTEHINEVETYSFQLNHLPNGLWSTNPRTYTQIHTPPWYKGQLTEPLLEFLICCSILKRFCLQWKAFDLVNKVRYILWVVALLEAYDITNRGRHLGFYQELEIRLKQQEMVIFCTWHIK